MKNIDFTQPGGFPLTQDQLGYLQTGWSEILISLAESVGSNITVPYIISGCTITKTLVTGTTYDYTITDGFVYYEGDIIRVSAGGLAGIDESVDAAYMLISNSATPLTYRDGSTPNVVLDSVISLMAQPIGTADDATHFLLSEVVSYGVALGMNNRAAWIGVAVSTLAGAGGISGTLSYIKDEIANTLALTTGTGLTVADPYNLTALPGNTEKLLCTLPFVGSNNIIFMAWALVNDGSGNICLDATSKEYIQKIVCYINTSGNVYALLPKPAAGCVAYNVFIDTIVPLA